MTIDHVRFDGQVAVVTGAGGGMGRAYALELARRGASVVVNDYGGGVRGEQDGSLGPAQAVVKEIEALGGKAVADGNAVGSATAARAIVQSALDAFGRIDVLINNAGASLAGSMTGPGDDEIERGYATHLIGAHHLMRAAWPHMADKKYGRILNTSSNGALGIGGNATYAAAKAGMIGLTLDASWDGRPVGILVNAVLPTAYSRMIEQIPDRNVVAWYRDNLPAEKVAAAMAYFLSSSSRETGRILVAGGGRLANLLFAEAGVLFDPGLDAEHVAGQVDELFDESRLVVLHDQREASARYLPHLPARPGEGPLGGRVSRAVGKEE